jgi:RND family efflux transporter MFP subunit
VLVKTTHVQRGSLPRIVMTYGTVQAEASARDTIVAPVSAVVGQVYVHVGEAVAGGAPLVLLVPSPATRAAYTQAASALEVARDSVRRTRELLGELLATRQQLADAEKSESDARAALAALRAQGAAGPTSLRAPSQALVTTVSASVSALVTEGTPLLELARANGLVLTVGVVPDQAAAIAAGDPASVMPIGETQSYPTKVLSRGSVVEPGSGLVPVRIALPPGAFLPGQAAQAAVTVGMMHGYVVPHEAVLIDDDGDTYVVQVVRGIAKIVHVRVLGMHADRDAIDGSLDVEAPLVLSGNYQLQDGMRVRFADSPGEVRR